MHGKLQAEQRIFDGPGGKRLQRLAARYLETLEVGE